MGVDLSRCDVGALHDSVDALLDAVGRGAEHDALAIAEGVIREATDIRDELRYQAQWRPQALEGFSIDEIEAADALADACGLDVTWVVSSTSAIQASYQVAINREEVDPNLLTHWRQTLRHKVAHREQEEINHREVRKRGR